MKEGKPMRIAVVSDIHGNLLALEAVVRDIARRSVDHVVNLGDSLSGPLLPKETAQFLMQQDWVHLAGNHERQILNLQAGSSLSDAYAHSQLSALELSWIASLRPVQLYCDDVLLCHGSPTSDVVGLLQTAERNAAPEVVTQRLGDTCEALILCGHTHVPRVVRRGDQLIVNPGSVGLQAYEDEHPHAHVVATGSPDARYALVEKNGETWTSVLISVPYAHAEMARLARLRDRPDWAIALMTGNME
jgi:putative phosphoesterase